MKNTILIATLIFTAALPRTISAEERTFHDLPAGAKLVLPEAVVAGWLIQPGALKKLKDDGFSFDITPNNKVCLALYASLQAVPSLPRAG